MAQRAALAVLLLAAFAGLAAGDELVEDRFVTPLLGWSSMPCFARQQGGALLEVGTGRCPGRQGISVLTELEICANDAGRTDAGPLDHRARGQRTRGPALPKNPGPRRLRTSPLTRPLPLRTPSKGRL